MRLARIAVCVAAFVLLAAGSPSPKHSDSYVLRLGHTTFMNGGGMSSSALRSIQRTHGERFLWFRRDGRTFVTTDDTALDRATALIRPQQELGEKQSELGMKQSELGMRQAELGREQAALGQEQARLAPNGDSDRVNELARRQNELSERQNELAKKQDELAGKQQLLADRQEEVSREIEKRFAVLADQLIRTGNAKEVSR